MAAQHNRPEWVSEGKGRVASLGMFIIDQFQTAGSDGQPQISTQESIGGGGVFVIVAMVCARLFLPARHCGLIVDTGTDFPQDFKDQLTGYGADMTWFRHRDGLTTRALNIYSGSSIGEGHQSFRYLSPQLRLHLRDLLLPPSPLASPEPKWVHIVCSTTRAQEMAREARSITLTTGRAWTGQFIWEPLPMSCIPTELPSFIELAPHMAVISPNLLEVQTLLGTQPAESTTEEEVIHAAQAFKTAMGPGSTAIIIRAGRLGSYTLCDGWSGWVKPYFTAEDQGRVIDPTGGGNGFLGGLCAGLLLSDGDFRRASFVAATAASFAIEQNGLPILGPTLNEGKEVWNDDDPWQRLDHLMRRHEVIRNQVMHR